MIFARVNTRKLARPLANSFDECDRLINTHCAAGIMTIFFEIEHEQDAFRSRGGIGLGPCIGNDAKKMIGLPDRIARIPVMIGAPEQSGPSRGLLSHGVMRIALERRVTGFMDHADD